MGLTFMLDAKPYTLYQKVNRGRGYQSLNKSEKQLYFPDQFDISGDFHYMWFSWWAIGSLVVFTIFAHNNKRIGTLTLPESALAGHNGTLVVQNKRSRIFFGPGEAGYEKNCKVNPRTFGFLKDFGGGGAHTFYALFSYFQTFQESIFHSGHFIQLQYHLQMMHSSMRHIHRVKF